MHLRAIIRGMLRLAIFTSLVVFGASCSGEVSDPDTPPKANWGRRWQQGPSGLSEVYPFGRIAMTSQNYIVTGTFSDLSQPAIITQNGSKVASLRSLAEGNLFDLNVKSHWATNDFSSVSDIEVSGGDTILVSGGFNQTVSMFAIDGSYLGESDVCGRLGVNGVQPLTAIAVASDGSFIAGPGTMDDPNNQANTNTVVCRYNADGSINERIDTGTTGQVFDMESAPGGNFLISSDFGVILADINNLAGATFLINVLSPPAGFSFAGPGTGDFRSLYAEADGSFWAVSESNNKVGYFAANGALIRSWGTAGLGDGELQDPIGIAVTSEDRVWVSDRNGRIQEFTDNGNFVSIIQGNSDSNGTYGAKATEIDWLNSQTAFVSYSNFDILSPPAIPMRSVQKIDTVTGDSLHVFGSSGSNDGEFDGDTLDVAACGNGKVWVIDGSTPRIQRFNTSGVWQQTIDTTPLGGTPSALECATDDTLWVSIGGSTLHHLTAAGIQTSSFAVTSTITKNSNLRVADDGTLWTLTNSDLKQYDATGNTLQTITHDASLDEDNLLDTFEIVDSDTILIGDIGGVAEIDYSGTIKGFVGYPTNENGDGLAGPSALRFATSSQSLLAYESAFFNRTSLWRYDTNHPTVDATSSSTSSTVTFDVQATDLEAGLAVQPYSFDGGTTWRSSSEFTVGGLTEGASTSVEVVVRDSAGNRSAPQTVTGTATATENDTSTDNQNESSGGTTSGDSTSQAGNSTILTPTESTDSGSDFAPTLTSTPKPGRIISNKTRRLNFTLRRSGSDYTSKATFQGRVIKMRGTSLKTRHIPEGKGELTVTFTDSKKREVSWSQRVIVDRTPPAIAKKQRMVMGTKTTVGLVDPLSGTAVKSRRFAGLKPGKNLLRVRGIDAAGNSRDSTTAVYRRMSLSDASLNAGFHLQSPDGDRFNPGASMLTAMFGGQGVSRPMIYSEHSPAVMREITWRLRRLGYLSLAYRDNTSMNETVRSAIKRFQRAKKIRITGNLDYRTRVALDKDILEHVLKPRTRDADQNNKSTDL